MSSKKGNKKDIFQLLQSNKLSDDEILAIIQNIKKEKLYQDNEIKNLLAKHKSLRLDFFLCEIEVISFIDDFFSRRRNKINSSFSSPSDELFHAILGFEQLQRQHHGKPKFDAFEFQLETIFLDGENYASPADAAMAIDHFFSLFSVVLTYLISGNNQFLESQIDFEKMHIAYEHVQLASTWQIFFEKRLFWEYGCASISAIDDQIVLDSTDDLLVSAFRISLSRLRAFRQSRSIDKLNNDGIVGDCAKLPIDEFRSLDEKVSCHLTLLQFYSADLSESFFGVKLNEWIRAYTVLKEEAVRFIDSHPKIETPKDILCWRTKKFFIDLFVQAHISRNSSEIILRHFTLQKSAKDILDNPLIPTGDDFVFVPSVTAMIEPAFSLESLLKNIKAPNHDLAVIGPGLERNIKKCLRDVGIQAEKVEHKKKFDCDVAFILDSVLFLCECKGKYQASDFKAYVDLENYLMGEAVTQHIRTCEFFEANLHLVKNKLNLPVNWSPGQIVRLIITSAKLGRPLQNKGIVILDENVFHAYFTRYKPRIMSLGGEKISEFHDDRLMGAANAGSFLDFITNPSVMTFFNGFKEERGIEIEFDNLKVLFRDVECYGESIMVEQIAENLQRFPFKAKKISNIGDFFA